MGFFDNSTATSRTNNTGRSTSGFMTGRQLLESQRNGGNNSRGKFLNSVSQILLVSSLVEESCAQNYKF